MSLGDRSGEQRVAHFRCGAAASRVDGRDEVGDCFGLSAGRWSAGWAVRDLGHGRHSALPRMLRERFLLRGPRGGREFDR
ncbi:hypothetical protein BIV57_21305 [Mangrovactinospora gilvigrisea]|uniref:Uncharacterized protein n=1 Tax=Mangrovactinospora gilvigrisea TaxID=1428644 RepID=A0A1J7B9X8_9ACTN|nr:hypothetical protein BIV57_21305 [Mangrovactinospora gilvigrisea]